MDRSVIVVYAGLLLVLLSLFCCREGIRSGQHFQIKAEALIVDDTLVFRDSGCSVYAGWDVAVSCEQAKQKARVAGYWKQNHWLYPPKIRLLDSMSRRIWEVNSTLVSYTRLGACKTTNGCMVLETNTIGLDAGSGVILYKRHNRKEIPVYE
jgi:hypothetical protein